MELLSQLCRFVLEFINLLMQLLPVALNGATKSLPVIPLFNAVFCAVLLFELGDVRIAVLQQLRLLRRRLAHLGVFASQSVALLRERVLPLSRLKLDGCKVRAEFLHLAMERSARFRRGNTPQGAVVGL